jgi:hypothetical protein
MKYALQEQAKAQRTPLPNDPFDRPDAAQGTTSKHTRDKE